MLKEDAKNGFGNYGFDPDDNPGFYVFNDGSGFQYTVYDNATSHFVSSEYNFKTKKYSQFSHDG